MPTKPQTRVEAYRAYSSDWYKDAELNHRYTQGLWPPGDSRSPEAAFRVTEHAPAPVSAPRVSPAPSHSVPVYAPAPAPRAVAVRAPRGQGGGCPVYHEPMRDRFDRVKVEGGRGVHLRCRGAEEQNVERARRAAEAAGDWLPLNINEVAKEALKAPFRQQMVQAIGENYSQSDILRLLSRADEKGFKFVLLLFKRMLERQTPTELRQGQTFVDNSIGFNQPDAQIAAPLLAAYVAQGYSKFLHSRMSNLLLKYVNTQLPEIMNLGAKEKGYAVRTNPGSISWTENRATGALDGVNPAGTMSYEITSTKDAFGYPSYRVHGYHISLTGSRIAARQLTKHGEPLRLQEAKDIAEADSRSPGTCQSAGSRSRNNPSSRPLPPGTPDEVRQVAEALIKNGAEVGFSADLACHVSGSAVSPGTYAEGEWVVGPNFEGMGGGMAYKNGAWFYIDYEGERIPIRGGLREALSNANIWYTG